MNEPEILSIKIDHRQPLELKRFTASMLCVESQYKRYLAAEGIANDDYDLFIHEVKQGSIVIDFIKGATKKLIEDYVLEKFISIFKEKIEAIVEQKSHEDLKEIGAIAQVISNDYQSNMTFEAHVGDKITNTFNIDGIQANAIVNECSRQLADNFQPVGEHVFNALLHWKSASEDKKSLSIDKGVIEEVDPNKKVKLVCEENLKQEMISENERNPFNMFFIVDAACSP